MVTANIDFVGDHEYAQTQYVLKDRPAIVLLQEVRELNLAAKVRTMKGGSGYGVIQYWQGDSGAANGGTKAASAILYRKAAFKRVDYGLRSGYHRKAVSPERRYLPWAELKSRSTGQRIVVVSAHMPSRALRNSASRAAYKSMGRHLRELVREKREAGRPVVVGGDWNFGLATNTDKRWDPVSQAHRVGLSVNWYNQQKPPPPCTGGTLDHHNVALDGFALRAPAVKLLDQGCRASWESDHKPVWMRFRISNDPSY